MNIFPGKDQNYSLVLRSMVVTKIPWQNGYLFHSNNSNRIKDRETLPEGEKF